MKIAIDIALLPPDDVMDRAIAVNQKIIAKYPSKLVLSKTERLPHITLLQAVIDEKNMEAATTILERIAREFEPLKLTAKLVYKAETSSNSFRVFGNYPELQKLHEQIMQNFKSLISYDAEAGYFDNDEVSERTIDYVKNFCEKSAYSNFRPHITLGKGEAQEDEDLSFTASRLAICHLGNFNTCKKVLFETLI